MKSALSSGKLGGIHETGEARGTPMDNEIDNERLAECLQLMSDYGEFQYNLLGERYIYNKSILPWPKEDIFASIKEVLLTVNNPGVRNTALAQLQTLARFQDLFNEEVSEVLVDDLFEGRATSVRDNRELLERFKEEMYLMIELSEEIDGIFKRTYYKNGY